MRSRIFYAVTERTLPDAVALHRHTRLGSAYASDLATDFPPKSREPEKLCH